VAAERKETGQDCSPHTSKDPIETLNWPTEGIGLLWQQEAWRWSSANWSANSSAQWFPSSHHKLWPLIWPNAQPKQTDGALTLAYLLTSGRKKWLAYASGICQHYCAPRVDN